MAKWFKIVNDNETAYTPFKENKNEWFHHENNRFPEPEVIVDLLNSRKNSAYLQDGLFIHQVEESKYEEVDLPPGIYRFRSTDSCLIPFTVREDEYIQLGSWFEEVQADLANFFDNEEFYAKAKTLYKLGMLLYGPPGCGKTSLVGHIVKTLLPPDAIIIFVKDLFSQEVIDHMNLTIKDQMKFIIIEELTTNLASYGAVERMLNFLDGQSSMNKQVVIATTNYPENLPGNIVDRPSRFDKLIEFPPPGSEDRAKILTHYLGREARQEEVTGTKGLSIAAIKEIVTLMEVSNQTFEQATKRLKDRSSLVKKAFQKPKTSQVGFGGGWDDE